MTSKTSYGICMLCEAACGIVVEHDGTRVERVRGDERDPFSAGHICPKGVALADLQNDPDRIRRPLRKRGDEFVEIPWDEALEEAAERIWQIQSQHGNDALGVYTGNPTGHSYTAILSADHLNKTLKTRNRFSAGSVDALPRLLVSRLMYGNQAILPIPDLERTDYLLVLGANPMVSNGSVMTAPDIAARLRALRARGGKLVVIDPRRNETAEVADAHYFIRPSTDALFLAAILNTLFAENRTTLDRVAPMLEGADALPGLFEAFTPERVAAAVGIDADDIRKIARDFSDAPTAACYGRLGTCVQDFAALCSWLIDLVNIVSGNFDRKGGSMFPAPATDLAALAETIGQRGEFDRWRSRVSNLPEFNGELPVAAFAEEMENPGPGQIRGLLTHAGNPVLSLPNGRRLERAFAKLEFMVSIDIYRNETTRHADLILPPTFGLEREHYPIVGHAVAVRNTVHYARPVLDKPADSLDDWEILLDLATRIEKKRGGIGRYLAPAKHAVLHALGPRALLRGLLRLGPYPLSLKQLEAAPHGIDLGPLSPRLPKLLGKQGRIQVAPKILTQDLDRLEASAQTPGPRRPPNGLLLIGRRSLRSNNSWMHNSERLVKGRDRCVLLMHPLDASERGLEGGQSIVLKSAVGQIEVPLEISDEVMPGVVSLPHGWGHGGAGTQQRVANAHAGASVNDVTDDRRFDPVSGTTSLNGVPVSVSAVSA